MSLTIQSPYNFNQKARSIAIFTRFQTAANTRRWPTQVHPVTTPCRLVVWSVAVVETFAEEVPPENSDGQGVTQKSEAVAGHAALAQSISIIPILGCFECCQ
jgi:hypothetical protein